MERYAIVFPAIVTCLHITVAEVEIEEPAHNPADENIALNIGVIMWGMDFYCQHMILQLIRI